ncbi:hypothetical protein B0H13DRAFT_2335495 [Mycena leptocephala]|nr:hypothetical protein B0H13DRAFT_2335495 [Mycena leptocephala]
MPPKRTRQESVGPETASKRARNNEIPSVVERVVEQPEVGEGLLQFGLPTFDHGLTDVTDDIVSGGIQGVEEDEHAVVVPHGEIVVPGPIPATDTALSNDAVDEISAIKILSKLGIEPGALAGVGLPTLNAVIASITRGGPVSGPESVVKDSDSVSRHDAVNPITVGSGAQTVAAASFANVGTPLQDLVDLGVAASRVESWTEHEMKRLKVLLQWADPTRNTYSIDKGPNKKDWGVRAVFVDSSNTVCAAGSTDPLTFWVPGEIASQWWFDNEGYPASRAAISIAPMVDSISEYCKNQLNELCMPTGSSKVAEQFGPSQVKASRWMNVRSGKGEPSKTTEFKAVYDARKSLRDKSLLPQLHVGQLKLHDIVVMEVRLSRYAVKEESSSDSKGKKRSMDRWQAFYDLQAVYKVKDAVEVKDVVVPVADFEI